jgi:hypothetical protein
VSTLSPQALLIPVDLSGCLTSRVVADTVVMTDADAYARLRDSYRALGFPPDAAAAAAESGDEAALAGSTLLRLCWAMIDEWRTPGALAGSPAAHRLVEAGAPVEELVNLARYVAYCTIFQLLYVLDEGPNYQLRDVLKLANPEFPGWQLVATDPTATRTDHVLSGLNEGLRGADPSGREGSDFLDE